MAKRKLYGNVLDIPLSPTLAATLIKGAEFAAKQNHEELEMREKALFQEYGLKRPGFIDLTTRKLIQKMAIQQNIIGFTEIGDIEKAGRPGKWIGKAGLLLCLQMQLMLLKYPDESLRGALDKVRRKYKYTENLDVLYVRYNEIKKQSNNPNFFIINCINELFENNSLTKENEADVVSRLIDKYSL